MNKPTILYGIPTAMLLACCLCVVSAGTLKAAAAEAISETNLAESKFEARGGLGLGHHGGGHHDHGGYGGGGGWGGSGLGGGGLGGGWGGNEAFTGPSVIALALPVAVLLIVALWVAAYNTLRSPAPKIGYNAGLVESAGWNQASGYISSGYEPSEQQTAISSNIASSAVIQSTALNGPSSGAETGKSIDELTHRVLRSIERQEKKIT